MDPRVLDAMLPYMVDKYGNPHSRTHAYGWESEDSVEVARKQAGPSFSCCSPRLYLKTALLYLLLQFHVIIVIWQLISP